MTAKEYQRVTDDFKNQIKALQQQITNHEHAMHEAAKELVTNSFLNDVDACHQGRQEFARDYLGVDLPTRTATVMMTVTLAYDQTDADSLVDWLDNHAQCAYAHNFDAYDVTVDEWEQFDANDIDQLIRWYAANKHIIDPIEETSLRRKLNKLRYHAYLGEEVAKEAELNALPPNTIASAAYMKQRRAA